MFRYAALSNARQVSLSSGVIASLRSRVALDLSFQSLSRWPDLFKGKYIASLLMGMAPSKIVLANIQKCKEQHAEGTAEWEYFDKWQKAGFEYISIDGNNRTITIDEYLKGQVAIPIGSYFIPVEGGYTRVEISKNNNVYGKHPSAMQEFVDSNVKVTIEEYVSATRDTLKNLFLAVNDGVKLNDQEIRNAYACETADWVRGFGQKYYTQMQAVFGEKEMRRRKGDELVVTMLVYSSNAKGYESDINCSIKDRAYTEEASVKSALTLTERNMRTLFVDLKDLFSLGAIRGKMGIVMNFYMLIDHLNRNKYKILDNSAMWQWFMETEAKRRSSTKAIWSSKDGKTRTYESASKVLAAGPMTARFKLIMKDFAKIPEGIVVQKDARRSFDTTAERMEMWERQGGVSPDGVMIPIWEVENRVDFPIDHIVPHSRGGKTEISNGQMTTRKYNSDKSDKVAA